MQDCDFEYCAGMSRLVWEIGDGWQTLEKCVACACPCGLELSLDLNDQNYF